MSSNHIRQRIAEIRHCGDTPSIRTYVLGQGSDRHHELFAFDIPIAGFTDDQVLDGEHHARAIALAMDKAPELRDLAAFDELEPAAEQMRTLVDLEREALGPEPVIVVQVKGGVVQSVAGSAPARVIVLDHDFVDAEAPGAVLLQGGVEGAPQAAQAHEERIDAIAAAAQRGFVRRVCAEIDAVDRGQSGRDQPTRQRSAG